MNPKFVFGIFILSGLTAATTAEAGPGFYTPIQYSRDQDANSVAKPPAGHIHYTGSYSMRESVAAKPTFSARGVFDALRKGGSNLSVQLPFGIGGNSRLGNGQIDIDLRFSGNKVSGTCVGQGRGSNINNGSIYGYRQGTTCYLHDAAGAQQQISLNYEARAQGRETGSSSGQPQAVNPYYASPVTGAETTQTAGQGDYDGTAFFA